MTKRILSIVLSVVMLVSLLPTTALAENAFTREGYKFVGWAEIADSTGIDYVDQQSVSNLTAELNGEVTLYAVWTRDMIVTILWRLEGEPVVNYLMRFEDIPAETWYTEAVRWAAREKIVEGYGDTFGPNDAITRAQAAALFQRFCENVAEK